MTPQEMLAKPSREEIEQLIRNEGIRGYRVDIESDSTIRGDAVKNQAEMSNFLQGTASYMQAVGPMVQTGVMPAELAVEIYAGFARSFRLGKQAEDSLDRLADEARKNRGQPKPPSPEQQKMALEQAKMQGQAQLEQQKMGAELQFKQAELGFKQQEHEQNMMMEREKMDMEREKFALGQQADQAKAQQDMALRQQEMEMSQVEKQTDRTMAIDQHRETMDMKREELDHKFIAADEDRAMAREREGLAPSTPREPPFRAKMEQQNAALLKQTEAVVNLLNEIRGDAQAAAQRLEALTAEMTAPAEIIRDRTGVATGVRKGSRTMKVERGPDGRALRVQ